MRKSLQKSMLGSLGAVSSTTTYTTAAVPMDAFNGYMIQIVWSGTPTATITLEVSADPIPDLNYGFSGTAALPQPTNYDTVASSSASTTGILIKTYDVTATAGNWVRLKWVNASGTGTITSINFAGKGSQT